MLILKSSLESFATRCKMFSGEFFAGSTEKKWMTMRRNRRSGSGLFELLGMPDGDIVILCQI